MALIEKHEHFTKKTLGHPSYLDPDFKCQPS